MLLRFFPGPEIYPTTVVLQLVSLVLLVRRWSIARAFRFMAALLLLVAAPVLVLYGPALRDAIAFNDWLNRYDSKLNILTSRPSVLAHWDSWGLAGMEWGSYFVADPADRLLEGDHAAAWAKQLDLGCTIGGIRRIRPKVFLIEARDCPIDETKVGNLR